MSSVWLEVAALLLLVLVNGVFAMSEIAIVVARRGRLRQLAAANDPRAAAALELAESPNVFLSTVQVGVTLVSVISGALGGARLAARLTPVLAGIPWLAPYSGPLAAAIVLAGITYLSVVLGELVPKRLALSRPEDIAAAVAPAMRLFSVLGSPVVHTLSATTRLVARVLGVRGPTQATVSDEEIAALFEEGTEAGVFEEAEQDMVKGVLLLGDRRANALMTPRPEVVWLDAEDPDETVLRVIREHRHTRYPVARGSLDAVIGVVQAKDVLVRLLDGQPLDLEAIAREPLYIPEVMPGLRVLETFRETGNQLGLVINEYGGVEGVLTVTDVMGAVVGEMPDADEAAEPEAQRREDGSWLVDGILPVEELKGILEVEELPDEEQGLYQTVGGMMMLELGHVPTVAERFEWCDLAFEVVDMEGTRVRKVLVTPSADGACSPMAVEQILG